MWDGVLCKHFVTCNRNESAVQAVVPQVLHKKVLTCINVQEGTLKATVLIL